SGTQLQNPDFAKLAEAYGGVGLRCETDAEVPAAVRRAMEVVQQGDSFALIHVITPQRQKAF
ncbi:MAG: acetolactate synthase, partial [Microbacteriaceae bacterium]|nr:acetolactate synthase [Microbacteriaceae bacterium]